MQADRSPDLARTTLQLLALGALIASSFWIVRPFLVALTWATMIVVATWPLLLHAQAWLGGRRSPAVAAMTIALLLILVVPLYFAIETIVENAEQIADWSKSMATLAVPQPPAWLEAVPVVGAKLAARWQQVAAASPDEISARLWPIAHDARPLVRRPGGQCRAAARPVPAHGHHCGDSVRERRDGGPRRRPFRPAAGGAAR